MTPRALILDRDGVINFDSPDYIKSPEEWRAIPGSVEAIARFHQAGYKVFIATNQAGIARGKLTLELLQSIHQKLLAAVENAGGEIAGIEYCPHHPEEGCGCRKPEPGMLFAIEKRLGESIAGVPYVGDSLKDVRAAEAAGCMPVLVLTGNGEETHQLRPDLSRVYDDLQSFAEAYLTAPN